MKVITTSSFDDPVPIAAIMISSIPAHTHMHGHNYLLATPQLIKVRDN